MYSVSPLSLSTIYHSLPSSLVVTSTYPSLRSPNLEANIILVTQDLHFTVNGASQIQSSSTAGSFGPGPGYKAVSASFHLSGICISQGTPNKISNQQLSHSSFHHCRGSPFQHLVSCSEPGPDLLPQVKSFQCPELCKT